VAKSPQPRGADREERKIGDNVPEVRDAEYGALVGELVVALVLRDRRQQQQSSERHYCQAGEYENGEIALHAAEGHFERIAQNPISGSASRTAWVGFEALKRET